MPGPALPFAIGDRNTCGAALPPPHSIQPGYSSTPSKIPGQWTIAFAIPHFPLSQAPPSPTALRFHFWILTKNCSPALALPKQPSSTPIANCEMPIANLKRPSPRLFNWQSKSAIENSFLFGHLRRVRTVFPKHACRRKFAELVADHILGDKNGNEMFSRCVPKTCGRQSPASPSSVATRS